jgi:hypothetical protein
VKAHGQRYLATEPGTLKFETLVPEEEADTVMRLDPAVRTGTLRLMGMGSPDNRRKADDSYRALPRR